MKLIREFKILPGYDKRSDEPGKNYGVHGCTVLFYVLNPARTRAVQFMCYTDWLPKNVQHEALHDPFTGRYLVKQEVIGEQPMAADLGYHSPKPFYKDQTARECDLIKSGTCYYDGSGLNAEPVRDAMLEKGSDEVWRLLEEYYHEVFDDNRTRGGFGETITAFSEALKEASDEVQPSE